MQKTFQIKKQIPVEGQIYKSGNIKYIAARGRKKR